MQTQKPGQSTEESTPLLSESTTTLSITTLPKPKETKEVSLSTTAKIYSDSGCKWNITTKSLLGGGVGAGGGYVAALATASTSLPAVPPLAAAAICGGLGLFGGLTIGCCQKKDDDAPQPEAKVTPRTMVK